MQKIVVSCAAGLLCVLSSMAEKVPVGGNAPLYSGPAYTASSYVQNGLIAQWDGIENAGLGQPHDDDAIKPVELIKGIETTLIGGDMPSDATSFTIGDGYLEFTAPEIIDAINVGTATVEIVLSKAGTLVHNGGVLAFGTGAKDETDETSNPDRGFWIYQQNSSSKTGISLINAVSYHGDSTYDYQKFKNIGYNVDGTNTVTFLLSDAADPAWYAGGAPAGTFTRGSMDIKRDSVCQIGCLPVNDRKARARIFSIRVYNRVLTAAEVAKNAAIDRRRFASDAAGAHSYVQDSLLAQWDGEENAGLGLHDGEASKPLGLGVGTSQQLVSVGESPSIPAREKSFMFGSGSVTFNSKEIIDAINAGSATVEIVTSKTSAQSVNNGGFVAFGTESSRGFWVYQTWNKSKEWDWHIGTVSYHAAASGEISYVKYAEDGTNTVTFLLSGDETSPWRVNDVADDSNRITRYATETQGEKCYIGSLGYSFAEKGTYPQAEIFSIRVYGKTLSDAELESNRIVDILRYSLHTWTGGGETVSWSDAANWADPVGAAAVPGAGSNVRISGTAVEVSGTFDLNLLALEKGGTLKLGDGVTVGTRVLLREGVSVARGGYTGSGPRGTRVDWLEGKGLLRVGGGLHEDIPAKSEFPYRGFFITIK